MDTLVLLHEQSASGPIVPAAPMWSANRMVLTVRPTVPLRSATSYVLHLVPGMMDAEGRMLSPATGSMMTGGSTAIGMMGSGSTMRRRTGGMMGAGWGPDGMTFSFTTG